MIIRHLKTSSLKWWYNGISDLYSEAEASWRINVPRGSPRPFLTLSTGRNELVEVAIRQNSWSSYMTASCTHREYDSDTISPIFQSVIDNLVSNRPLLPPVSDRTWSLCPHNQKTNFPVHRLVSLHSTWLKSHSNTAIRGPSESHRWLSPCPAQRKKKNRYRTNLKNWTHYYASSQLFFLVFFGGRNMQSC